jgi:2-polyprenyl-3-methyl-5-hydroxy-6-metoxy-1,4-benzoquinol methylase
LQWRTGTTRPGGFADADLDYRQALATDPKHAPSLHFRGALLMRVGRAADAVAHFQAAIRADPQLTDAYLNLAQALLRHGKLYDALGVINRTFELGLAETRSREALALVRQALEIEESVDTRTLFVQCVRNLSTVPDADGIRALMIRALTEPWGRPADLSAAATSLITKDKAISKCDALLRALLTSTCIRDVALERHLTRARAALLDAALGGTPADEDAVAFACALASQSFINEYAFAGTDAEMEQARRLRDLRDITPVQLAALASYEPLHARPGADALLARDWPEAVDALLDLQLRQPREETRIRETIRALTPITGDVSLKVRAQYEQNPYPRWIKIAPIGHATALDAYLAKFPGFRALGAAAPEVLIAGCGTGQHVATVALQFTDLNILAVDLSRASLAYAQRATQSLGLTGIDYAQADIMALGALGRSFDLVDSSGVLHHLADPFAGWRVLLALLRPGGVMRLGLYSTLGRQDVAAVRQYAAARGYSGDAASIRACRQDLMGFPPGTPQRAVAATSDFFSTSECRDLLFHVQEHTLTLPQIADFIAANALIFLGFEGCAAGYQRYAQLFPDDAAIADLGRWTRIEGENPRLFVNMYQFWIQKPR